MRTLSLILFLCVSPSLAQKNEESFPAPIPIESLLPAANAAPVPVAPQHHVAAPHVAPPAPVPADDAPVAADPPPKRERPHRPDSVKQESSAPAKHAAAPAPVPGSRPVAPSSDRKPFVCPEVNGLFPDPEQCDLYYICEKSVATEVLCDDGLLFDDSIRNREKCVLPHNVDCGDREFVQEVTAGIDPRCHRANGFFDHEDPAVCDKFYSCDKGTAFEMPCASPLHFDSKVGSCVRREQLSADAKKCDGLEAAVKSIDGFSCPGTEKIGPHGLIQQHPIFPHPSDCQFFFTCFFGKEPNKFGCSNGQVFDAESQVCKDPKEVKECGCWYSCDEKSKCPDSCNADCSCP